MRYLINDDDYEDWISKLEEVYCRVIDNNDLVAEMHLEYVITMMKAELTQHKGVGCCG